MWGQEAPASRYKGGIDMENALQVFEYKGVNVRTVERDGDAFAVTVRSDHRFEIGKSPLSVDLRLSDSQHIEVGTVDNKQLHKRSFNIITLLNVKTLSLEIFSFAFMLNESSGDIFTFLINGTTPKTLTPV